MRRLFAFGLLIFLPFAIARAAEEPSWLSRAQSTRDSMDAVAADSQTDLETRMRLRLRAHGRAGSESEMLELQSKNPSAYEVFVLEVALNSARYDEAAALASNLADNESPLARTLRYKWLFIREDLRVVDSLFSARLKRNPEDAISQLARAELLYRTVQYDSSISLCRRISASLAGRDSEVEPSRLLLEARLHYKKNQPEDALAKLPSLFNVNGLDAEVLYQTGVTLIRVGRTNEAIDMFEEAVRWNPAHELAHYYLGNGYARLNYSQLADSVPAALALATDLTLEASKVWTARDFNQARALFEQALKELPAFGRAHNGLAKAIEGVRMTVNVHRAEDEKLFASQVMPVVPQIEKYVLNWSELSARHQKQVAIAVAPWKAYIPLLVESHSHHFIKPLHYRLSECPGVESLKDERISYDSRLWDDVRGCGGYTTVTGIEDVERSIFFAYNTVLHELTHQVHGCFPPNDIQALDDAFETARKRDDGGTPTFMSRYQASSVWEYFAEGANGYYSPRRDEYDTREITRERLYALDTALVRLVEKYISAPSLDRCWPVGLINAADDRIEKQQLDSAISFARKAQLIDPHAEVVLEALSRIYSIRDEDTLAVMYADSLVRFFPEKGKSFVRLASAIFTMKANSDDERIQILQLALMGTDTSDRKQLMQSLGDALVYAGRYEEAREAYRFILDREPTNYTALWGLATASRNSPEADSLFRLALKERTGLAGLRFDYARYLLKAGKIEDARTQMKECELLAPKDGEILTLRAMIAELDKQRPLALALYDQALSTASSPRLAAVKKAGLLRATKKKTESAELVAVLTREADSGVPSYIYDTEVSNYTLKNLWPYEVKQMLRELGEQN